MPAALTANWINPLLFSWPVDDAVLEPLLPSGLVIDRWQGRAYLSLVGLRFESLRIFGIPAIPRRYAEVNLRFYARRPADGDAAQPGVVFIRQIVPHRLTAWLARSLYGEPFTAAWTGHQFSGLQSDESELRRRVAYHWQHAGRPQRFWAESDRTPAYAAPGSLAEFLTARHWGYNRNPVGRARAYQLTRPAWTLRDATHWGLDCDTTEIYGSSFGAIMEKPPASVLLASGSPARVHLPRRLPAR